MRRLIARGLSGVKLVISDAHRGLVAAIGAALPGASWQRCRTRYLRNLLTKVSRPRSRGVATLVRTVFDQPDADAVKAQFDRVVQAINEKFPAAAEHLHDARADLLAFTDFPRERWSNNPQQRLNIEIPRRTDVVGIFPDRAAISAAVDRADVACRATAAAASRILPRTHDLPYRSTRSASCRELSPVMRSHCRGWSSISVRTRLIYRIPAAGPITTLRPALATSPDVTYRNLD